MKINLKHLHYRVLAVGSLVCLVTVLTLCSFAWAKKGNSIPRILPAHAYPFGKSYGEWSAEWWKWQLNLPATNHPAFSTDGENCDAGQDGKVWFLTGAFTNEVPENDFNTIIRESCVIPTGKAIFFPIVNIECSTVESAPYLLIEEGLDENIDTCAANFVEGPFAIIQDLAVFIDGRELNNLENYRVQSPVFDFDFEDPADNILGVDCDEVDCENARSVSDGYWIMLPPLSRGDHEIQFTGSFRDPETKDLYFGLDVTYELTVAGGKR